MCHWPLKNLLQNLVAAAEKREQPRMRGPQANLVVMRPIDENRDDALIFTGIGSFWLRATNVRVFRLTSSCPAARVEARDRAVPSRANAAPSRMAQDSERFESCRPNRPDMLQGATKNS